MPLPRKLVRGQDVWLGKGAEQTRQILKCMWCGQSFRSLAEMTSHMQQTQHYTNIISQEQIISWKSADEGKSGGSGSSGGVSSSAAGGASSVTSSHVSAVLTCKVCDQAFSSLKDLSNHMVKNSHYKEHIMRSITESGGRRRQTREKRKKSLPVRKLLELERAQNDMKNGESFMMLGKHNREIHAASRITCEKCGEKIDMAVFVDHIRLCIGSGAISSDHRNLLKNALLSSNMHTSENPPSVTQTLRESRKIKKDYVNLPSVSPPAAASDLSINSEPKASNKQSDGKNSTSPSVLNAIEKLIEKSFDSRGRHGGASGGANFNPNASPGNAPIGSSILKRLGIDESVDYTKPLVDAQTINLLRSYHHHQQANCGRRERSGSESSSVSDRGLSRHDSLTPEKKFDSPEKLSTSSARATPENVGAMSPPEDASVDLKIKREPEEEAGVPLPSSNRKRNHVDVKAEIKEEDEVSVKEERDRVESPENSENRDPQRRMSEESLVTTSSVKAEDDEEPRKESSESPASSPKPAPESPCRNSASPASSDRSATSRSDKKSSGSLGALSSMFDNLSGGNANSSEPTTTSGKGTSHPLAALQKLCDKTETHHPPPRPSLAAPHGSTPVPLTTTSTSNTPGAILAFSWACNDAVVNSDSIMKCAFCDTPFISKGAYRHHLSKMHFVKDGVIPDPVALKSPSTPPSKSSSSSVASTSAARSPTQQNNFEESPHSKFLKYTELAKQLSSKYV
ncbi:unnamed protein product [Bemisia tabaci]|uniref:C2H2-type domain-containing protein n=2 Tax=Bemisia tabaci TaxID=7038 RepID=A0A9P0F9N8_BEMTA|nr:unnamed protein product [Bemisia tabaci]